MIEPSEARKQYPPTSSSKRTNQRRGEMFKSHSMHEQISLSCIFDEGSPVRSSTLRQTQQLSLIKDKFKRMIELQNRNFIQRNQLHKEREAILQEQQSQARSRVNRVKDQRVSNGEATRSWRVRNMQEGAMVRQRRLRNEWVRAKRDIAELKDKQSMISDRHKSFLATHTKPFFLESKTDSIMKRRLKVSQEYRCGLIREMSSLIERK